MTRGGDNKSDRKLQVQIFDSFSKLAREKVLSALDDEEQVKKIDALYSRPEFSEERKMLTDMNNLGLMNGVVAGIACFAFLRWSPGAIARYLTRRRAADVGVQLKGDSNNPFNKPSKYQFDAPPGEHVPLSSPNFVIRGLRLGLDIFVSMSVGAWASILLIDKDRMMKEVSEIPLVQGRSLISEELCQDFSLEFKKYGRDTWDTNHPALSNGGRNGSRKSEFSSLVEGFVANCKRRSIYEQELRSERGLRDDEPVVIPAPGVPKDIFVTLDDLMGDRIVDENRYDGGNESDFDRYFEKDGFDNGYKKD